MGKFWRLGLVLLVIAAGWFFLSNFFDYEGENEPEGRRILLRQEAGLSEIPLEEAVVGFVAAEMPASYDQAALAAQAVAARTYAWRRFLAAGEVCDDSSHCLAYLDEAGRRKRWGSSFGEYEAKVRQAAAETAGMVLMKDGELIDACFHASCGGMTETASACWGGTSAYPAAACFWEGGGRVSACFWPKAELAERLGVAEKDLGLLYAASYTASGRVGELRCGEASWSGAEFREALGLASCRISWLATAEGFWFTCLGYGHGVGLCQQGAAGMAAAGASWQDILGVYYAGCEVVSLDTEQADSENNNKNIESNTEAA